MDGRTKRILTHRHNSHFGSAHMMRAQAEAIIRSPTVTDETKELATIIRDSAAMLIKSLKTRKPWPDEPTPGPWSMTDAPRS